VSPYRKASPLGVVVRPWSAQPAEPWLACHTEAACHTEGVSAEEIAAEMLRAAGAVFAFVHGSRVDGRPRAESDVDVAAWWARNAPAPWEVDVPAGVDLVVLNAAPLWLAGRVAQHGRLILEVDPAARVAWQADTRLRYLDELLGLRARIAQRRRTLARGAGGG